MPYGAYLDSEKMDYSSRDTDAGIIGTIKPTADPIVTAEDLETLKMKALAYLIDEPKACLYLADSSGCIYQELTNSKYYEAQLQYQHDICICWVILLFSMTALVGSVYGGGWWVVGSFIAISVLYWIAVGSSFNKIEAAIGFEILLIIALMTPQASIKASNHKHLVKPSPVAAPRSGAPHSGNI